MTLAVLGSMLRQPALRRLGLRNLSRRKWNTVLVVVGSMVGTALISGSLVLNDSTSLFQENEARQTLGEIDEVVQQTGQRLPSDRRPIPSFGEPVLSAVTPENIQEESRDLEGGPVEVDGVLPALVQEVPAEADGDGEELATPAATLIGVDWESLGEFGSEPPPVSGNAPPGPGEAYVSEGIAEVLELDTGSAVTLTGQTGPEEFEVAGVVAEDGISGYRSQFSSSEGPVLVDEAAARALLGTDEGEANTLFVSNEGGVTEGVEDSEEVAETVQSILGDVEGDGAEFQVNQVKRDTIEQGGFQIGDIFLMISSFAILAGILLIINIYVMLAEERKGELGILRAVALKRSGLVRLFVYEGYAYSLIASLVGTLVGLGIAAALVQGLNRASSAFEDLFGRDLAVPFNAEPASLLAATSAGLLITFLAVFVTSLRVSNLNIVSAIRDLPEERPQRRPRGRLAAQALLFAGGLAVSLWGFAAENGYAMLIGPVLAAFGFGFLLSLFVPARPLWSVVSAAVLAYAYFANEFEAVAVENEESPAMFFVSGVLMVLAAVLLVTFNLSFVYGGLRLLMRLVPALAPILRIAVAHPAAKRSRTGFTLAMFALILYVVTVSAVFSSTQNAASERTRDAQLSGYDGAVQSGPLGSIEDFEGQVEENPGLRDATEGTAALSAGGVVLPEYEADDYETAFGPPIGDAAPGAGISEYVTYVPDGFLGTTTDELSERLPEFGSDREAWEALSEDTDLVMLTFPYDGSGDFLARPELGAGDTIVMQDPVTGEEAEKTVAGRIDNPGGFNLGVVNGIIVSERAEGEFTDLQAQETYLLELGGGVDVEAVSRELEDEFAAAGAQSFLVEDILGRGQVFIDTFVNIVQAFLAFGLVVGVAGLAVISARSVHERRREIGTLRAVGFKKSTVGWQFLVESSLVSLIGIVIGISVGALGGYNLFNFVIEDPSAEYVFPWIQMALIGVGVWLASLLATIVPAVRASRVPPVEALRHGG